ncbi:MAG: nuclear transport factor 2 family protein [Woeseia sp.]
MSIRYLTVILLCVPWIPAPVVGHAGPAVDDPRFERLEIRRTRFKEAFVAADVAVLESIVAPHYTHTNDKSEPLDRAGWLDSMRRRQDAIADGDSRITQFDSEYFPLKIHGDTAVITGITTMRGIRDGSEYGMLINFTHVWEWDGNDWYRIAFHDTYQPLEK